MEAQADETLTHAIERFDSAKILCVGDLMLDRFVYGSVGRISPEAPIPVLHRNHEKTMPGGAGNVMRNIVSLGASCTFISVIGDDATGHALTAQIGEQPHVEPWLITEAGRRSTEKSRYIAASQQLLRVDDESQQPVNAKTEQEILKLAAQSIAEVQLLILSDYGKGVLTDTVITGLIALAKQHEVPVFIDPKRQDWSVYRGATLLSPNLSEMQAACGQELKSHDAICEQARAQCETYAIDAMLVTRGPDGMSLIEAQSDVAVRSQAKEVYDVSGAGDSVMATLAVAVASGVALHEAAILANMAGGIVVGRTGTATIYRTDLKAALWQQQSMGGQHKLFSHELAQAQVAQWKADSRTVGFTNGCFDVLHVGHLQSLQDAKAECDRLIVAVNSDASVKRLKGESRPINAEKDRAMLLAGLDCVDMVVIFREDTPETLIEKLHPDILMKGADYSEEQVVGRDIVLSYGGRIALLPIREGYSTTETLKRVEKSG